MKRLQIQVTGKVQGVSFRAATQQVAQNLQLNGYARNNDDGSVTIIAEGEETQLQKLLDWATRGPDVARVDSIQHEWREASSVFDHFSTL
jgi:acylphosphatase